jgi:hypothetical protein
MQVTQGELQLFDVADPRIVARGCDAGSGRFRVACGRAGHRRAQPLRNGRSLTKSRVLNATVLVSAPGTLRERHCLRTRGIFVAREVRR